MPKKRKSPLQIIRWNDHSTYVGWSEAEDVEIQEHPVTSVGWVVKEDKRAVVLAATRNQEGSSVQRIHILKPNIVSRKNIRE